MSARAERRFAAADASRRAHILSYGHISHLVLSREKAFSEAGFDVNSTTSPAEVAALIGAKRCDVLVVGHTVPENERNRVASLFRSRNPGGRIVFLYLGSIQNADLADAVISVTNPPADLAITIAHQVQRARAE